MPMGVETGSTRGDLFDDDRGVSILKKVRDMTIYLREMESGMTLKEIGTEFNILPLSSGGGKVKKEPVPYSCPLVPV